jgi:hypothetical protein
MKATIRLSLFLLLLTQIVFGQNRTVQQDALIQSRGNNNQPINFSTNKNLYPPKLASLNKNAIYEIKGNKIKFYVFEAMNINKALIANLSNITPTQNTVTEINDIYLDQDTYGVRVLRSGEFEYKTYVIKGKFERIITFEAIMDVIPKDAYYFDFPAKNTLPKKDCYDTTKIDGKKAFLKFQSANSNEPTVEWLKPENTADLQRTKKITSDETLKSSWSFDLRFTEADKNRIEAENKDQIFFYKLNNINTIFRLKVRIGFGCPPSTNIRANQSSGNIFIPPYAGPFKQPNSTNMDVFPPN